MTAAERALRERLVRTFRGWLGWGEQNGRYLDILAVYNRQRPLPRGYAMQAGDEWCAAAVTAAGIAAGLADIILPECSCSAMIALYQAAGRWVEDDGYVPEEGDILLYCWSDTGRGDCLGAPNHVGVVCGVAGRTITVIEGNKGGKVATREIAVGGRYIRGYCLPDYAGRAARDEGGGRKEDAMEIYHWFADMPDWARASAEKAYQKGLLAEDPQSHAVNVYASNLQALVWLDRLGLLD